MHMRTLSLDLVSHHGHLACINDDRIVALRAVERVSDAALLPLFDELLQEASWKPADIERIACNVGPGGFTSLRVEVSFANALADQLKIPIAGFHGSALALARTKADLWAHSTRSDQLFVLGGLWTEPTLVELAALPSLPMTVAGDVLDTHRAALIERGATFSELRPFPAILPAFVDGLSYGEKALVPWYGRGI